VEAAKQENAKRKELADRDQDDGFEEVWVVFDTEGPQNTIRLEQARNAIEQARNLGFFTAVSNPCFEYWFLLHFEWCVQMFMDAGSVCNRLKTHIRDYSKAKDYYAMTKPKVQTALVNAKRVFRERCQRPQDHPCNCLPCTQVYRLVEKLLA
jgi:RloB-like protein